MLASPPRPLLISSLLATALVVPVAGDGRGLRPGTAGAAPQAREIRFVELSDAGIDVVNVTGDHDKDYIVETIGSGSGWIDYDRDGRLDLYVANGADLEETPDGAVRPGPGMPNVLHRNQGDGRFTAVTAGVEDTGWAGGVAAADFDNDGFVDLYVTNVAANALYRNQGDGTFARRNDPAGVVPTWSTSSTFADLDADGFLDLYVANYVDFPFESPPAPGSSPDCRFFGLPVMCGPRGLPGATDVLLHNAGDGSFSPWQRERIGAHALYGLGVVPVDFDDDGDADLYVANDSVPNLLWRNDDGRLVEVGTISGAAASSDGLDQAGMGVDAGDVTGDGLPDLFVTNFSHDHNTLYVNAGDGFFFDRSVAAGVAGPSLPMLGWAAAFVDVDNDGDLDVLSLNGHTYPGVDEHDIGTTYLQPPQLMINDGTGTLTERPFELGSGVPRWSSRGAAFGDFDDDGDVDLHVVDTGGPGHLLENRTPESGWLGIQLRGRVSNRDGLGAKVTVRTLDGDERVRWARTGGSYLSSNDPRVHFGLGDDDGVASVEIRWPSGATTRIDRTAGRRWLLVDEERGVVATRAGR